MDSENTEKIYCDICDKFAIAIYYPNHLKSQIHLNSFYR